MSLAVEPLCTGYGNPDAPEGSLPHEISQIEQLDAKYAEAGLELPEDTRQHLGKLVATLEALQIDLTPHFLQAIPNYTPENNTTRPLSRDPEFIGAGLTDASDLLLGD